ncbi:MAG: flagellar M-ring protein FliF C-terminal domain-containing protein, partial [Oscillospiraceae bacterium]
VGAETNADIPNYSGITADENNIYFKDYSNYKYAVNKTTEQITSEAGTLSDLTVTFTVNKSKRVLSEEDKVEFQRAVANAAGVPITKVQILNTEFYSDTTDIETSVMPMSDSAYVMWVSICSVLLLAVIIGLMIMNDKMKTKQAEMDKFEEQIIIPVADAVPSMEDEIKKAPESRENALRKEIKEFADNNPLIVAQLIRTWLRGDEDDE